MGRIANTKGEVALTLGHEVGDPMWPVQVGQGEHSITSYIEGYAVLRSMVGLFLQASIIASVQEHIHRSFHIGLGQIHIELGGMTVRRRSGPVGPLCG